MSTCLHAALLGCSLFATTSVHASHIADSNACHTEGTYQIQVPVYPDHKNSPNFTYTFAYQPGTDPSLPVIVHLPGGPGGSSINQDYRDWLGVPHEFGLVTTDPRGAGCNDFDENTIPNDALSTAYFAADIVSAVHALKLNHYAFYGHSYGTELATVAAYLAEHTLRQGPDFVLFEGVLGKYFAPDAMNVGFADQWNQIRSTLRPEAQRALAQQDVPFGMPMKNWINYVMQRLYQGTETAAHDYNILLAPRDKAERDSQRWILDHIEAPTPDGRVFKSVACRELLPVGQKKMHFARGQMDLIRDDDGSEQDCRGWGPMSQPFDSAQFPLQARLFYFNSTDDPSTTMEQARYHFEHQRRAAQSTFVSSTGAGHMPLIQGFSDCKRNLFLEMAREDADLRMVLNECQRPSKVDVQK
ncbi:MAG: alpha/beta hydrolase [Bdellovibrionales bacterium]|nr:alpha/beta hydrolase [Bdellovibrionales bacterium]